VDALSPHVPTTGYSTVLAKQLILKEQHNDFFCERQKQARLTKKSDLFGRVRSLIEEIEGEEKSVDPQSLVRDVIMENHDPIIVEHSGNKRTTEVIFLRHWWPKMLKNIEDYVFNCEKCQTRKGKQDFRAQVGDVETPCNRPESVVTVSD
jgi:hypothetical protein